MQQPADNNRMFRYYTGTIADLVQLSRSAGSTLLKKIVSPVSDRQLQDFHSAGLKVSKSYTHTIDNCSISHAIKRHGLEKEKLRGQLPITADDFEKVNDILENYDKITFEKNRRGQSIIKYSKEYAEDITLYVEEVRVGRKELAMATIYKTKGLKQKPKSNVVRKGITNDVLAKSPTSDTLEATLDFPFSEAKIL